MKRLSSTFLLAVAFAVLCLGGGGNAQAGLPTAVIGSGPNITPDAAWSYFQTQTLTSTARAADPDVARLATALGNDPDKIYAYVHDQIELTPVFGGQAGVRGALIDKAGTAFDQAQLMAELLRAAPNDSKYTRASVRYQLGKITLTGAQFTGWFGVAKASAAQKLLNDGGFPNTVTAGSGDTITSVTLMHVWVLVTISGTEYAFDPSFKAYTTVSAMHLSPTTPTLDGAMGFSGATLVSDVGPTAAADAVSDTNGARVRNINRGQIQSDVQGYSQALLAKLKSQMPDATLDDVVGGRAVVKLTGTPTRQTALSYATASYTTFANNLPPALRTKVTLQFTDSTPTSHSFTWFADELYGDQLTFKSVTLKQPAELESFIFLRGDTAQTGWLTGTIPAVNVTIDHPYAATVGGIAGGYMDRTVATGGGSAGTLQVILGFGKPSPDLGSWQEARTSQDEDETQRYYSLPGAPPPEDPAKQGAQTATRRRMGASLLAQLASAADLTGRIGGGTVQLHDLVGSVTGDAYPGDAGPAATDFLIGMEAGLSATSNDETVTSSKALQRTLALMVPTLEGSVTEQIGDATFAGSAPAKFDWAAANNPTQWFYYANASNWTWVKGQVLNDLEGGSPAKGIAQLYIDGGYDLVIPQSSDLGPGPQILTYCRPAIIDGPACQVHGPDRGAAFVATLPDGSAIAQILAKQYSISKGGGGTDDAEVLPSRVFPVPAEFDKQQYTFKALSSSVNLRTGQVELTPPADLTVGNGAYPYSLSFQRSYRSGVIKSDPSHEFDTMGDNYHPKDKLFGETGWTSNLQHKMDPVSEGIPTFGRDNPQAATSTIAAIRAMLYLSADGASTPGSAAWKLDTLKRQVGANIVAYWWTQTIPFNTLTLTRGAESQAFTRLADGTWAPPPGVDASVVVYNTRTLRTPPRGSPWWGYDQICVKMTGADRSVSYYGPWDSAVTSCAPAAPATGAIARASFKGFWFRRQSFPFGVTVDYVNGVLSNNLGRSLVVTGGADTSGVNITVADGENASRVVTLTGTDGANTASIFLPRSLTVTDVLGKTWTFKEVAGSGAVPAGFEIRSPLSGASAFVRYDYDPLVRGLATDVKDAYANATLFTVGGGRAGAVIDPLGAATYTSYDIAGRPVTVTDALGFVTTTDYDVHGRAIKVTQPELNWEATTYDTRNNVLTKVRGPKPGALNPGGGAMTPVTVLTATYDSTYNVPLTETDALGRVTTYTYYSTGLLHTTLQPAVGGVSPTWTYAYNSLGQRTSKTDPTGIVLAYGYNAANYLSTVTAASGTLNLTTAFTYDSMGDIVGLDGPRTDVTDVTNAVWDKDRRLVYVLAPDPDGAGALKRPTARYVFDDDGQLTSIDRGTAVKSSTGFDPAAFAAADFTLLETVSAFTYDANGGKIKVVTQAGVTQYSYDADQRPLCTAVRMNPATYGSLPADACALSGTVAANDAAGIANDRIVKQEYTARGEAWKTTRALGIVRTAPGLTLQQVYSTYAYTPNGQQLSVADARGDKTAYVYDGFDRLHETDFPQATAGTGNATVASGLNDCVTAATNGSDNERYCYDLADNRIQLFKRDAHVIGFTYDALNRETLKDLPDVGGVTGADVSTSYDLAGRKLGVLFTASGQGVVYGYDQAGRVTSESSFGRTMTYGYEDGVDRTKVSWPDGFYARYSYDAMGRASRICENIAQSTCASATTTAGGLLARYDYDDRGRRTTISRGNGTTTSYGYDPADRLTSLAQALGGTGSNITWGFSYNAAGQDTGRTDSNSVYAWLNHPSGTLAKTYDGLNRDITLVSAGGYDANQNQTRDDEGRYFAYDPENRLTTVKAPDNATVQLAIGYDPLGRLQQTSGAGAATTAFLYDGDRLSAEYDSSGTPTRRYVHGTGVDEPLVWYQGAGTSDRRFLYTDRQGSVIAQADGTTGVVGQVYAYGPWGEPQSWSGARFSYTGQVMLPEARLYYYKARIYDPGSGRFLQTDPIGYKDDLDLYAYVGGDPVNRTDPSGNSPADDPVSSAAIADRAMNGSSGEKTTLATAAAISTAGVACLAGGCEALIAVVAAKLGISEKVAPALTPLARGTASEGRVLKSMGLTKNTKAVVTAEGKSVPDSLTSTSSVEVKDAARVSATKQVRIQTDAAAASGRQSVLVTGNKTAVTGPAAQRFDQIVRRPDLGPK